MSYATISELSEREAELLVSQHLFGWSGFQLGGALESGVRPFFGYNHKGNYAKVPHWSGDVSALRILNVLAFACEYEVNVKVQPGGFSVSIWINGEDDDWPMAEMIATHPSLHRAILWGAAEAILTDEARFNHQRIFYGERIPGLASLEQTMKEAVPNWETLPRFATPSEKSYLSLHRPQ